MSKLMKLLQKADFYKEKISSAGPFEFKKDSSQTADRDSAYDFIMEFAKQQRMNISEQDIIKVHRLFYQQVNEEEAGRYRTQQVIVSEAEYVHPAPEEIPRLMNHLTEQIRSSEKLLHPIELAAMAHKRIVDICPFTGGNGRAAEYLMNLILVCKGYPTVFLQGNRTEKYVASLTETRQRSDMDIFSELIAECVVEAQEEYCRQHLN